MQHLCATLAQVPVPGPEGRARVVLAAAVASLELRCLVSSYVKGLGKHSTRQKPSKTEHVLLVAGCCSS